MSVFTSGEIEYLRSHTMGRLATIGRDGQPHVTPLTYVYNPIEDSIDLGGVDFANTKKWRDVQQNRRVTFLVDDFAPTEAHAVEVRGDAEVHQSGGSKINPRIPNFVEQFIPPSAYIHRQLGRQQRVQRASLWLHYGWPQSEPRLATPARPIRTCSALGVRSGTSS
jgi:pyridoxamine 5'-phosphate oxidase family protein